jgi:DNA replication and repair protein RecF
LTVITGDNGAGKTSLLEAIAYIANQQSFRDSPREALIREAQPSAIIRSCVLDGTRELLMEIEIDPTKRDVIQRNRQRILRSQDLRETLRVTIFTPDDLALVKNGPLERRRYLDQILIAAHPKMVSVVQSFDKVLRQRNVLLKQSGGRLNTEIENTLDVWDTQFCDLTNRLVDARRALVFELIPRAGEAFQRLTRFPHSLQLEYQSSYEGSIEDALVLSRHDDLRRGVSTVGPHRDDLFITAEALDARTRLSQGRQRAVTLALRLAAHDVVTKYTGSSPVLLLDDVFSELDEPTSEALFSELPAGQTLLTTAGVLPKSALAHQSVILVDGGLHS